MNKKQAIEELEEMGVYYNEKKHTSDIDGVFSLAEFERIVLLLKIVEGE
jgi:muramoyltetrapeptide carboxypeptidase LdcA involved in peptidoglycan recycling